MFELRYYQQEMVEAVFSEWEKVQSTAIIAATATGKTQAYLTVAVQTPGRVLVLVHRDYLITQPAKRLRESGFDDIGVEKAESRSEGGLSSNKVVFASVQSLSRPNRLATFDPMKFDAVIVDEAHRAVARTYRVVLDHFKQNPRLRVLLLTATPKRKDGIALGNVCDSVAYTFGPMAAINEGWIVPLKFYRREVQDLDFSMVKLKGTDLDPEMVERLLMEEKPLHHVCATLAEDQGPTVIFCPGVLVARAYCELMNTRYRPGRAAVLWQDSTEEDRDSVKKMISTGDVEYLFNCDLVTEGYDVPELVRCVWAAPTASLVKFTQGTGRVFRVDSSLMRALTGTREDAAIRRQQIAESPKPFAHVVTYYPQNCKHQLCEPNDILGGDDLPPDLRAYAKQVQEETAKQPSGSDPTEDIETASSVIELRRLLEERRRKIKAEAEYHDAEYDGFGGRNRAVGSNPNSERRAAKEASTDWPEGKDPSPSMKGWFRYRGIDADRFALTAWRAFTIRKLVGDHGVSMETALSFSKRQALAVLQKYKSGK